MTIPQLKNTEEALAFGKIATPKQRMALHKLRGIALHKSNTAIAQGKYQGEYKTGS